MRCNAATLLAVGFGLAILAWVFGNPPGAAPDEPSHFFKAVAAGRGDLVGSRTDEHLIRALFGPQQRQQVEHSFRSFAMPPALRYQSNLPCTAFRPDTTARCLRNDDPRLSGDPAASIVGGYQPFLYVPAGLLARLSGRREAALRWARVGSAGLSVALLAMAVWFTWDGEPTGRPTRLLGLVVAVSPMVVFMASEVGASGQEITGAVAFAAAMLRVSRRDAPAGRTTWVLVGVAGLLLALSRPLAPLWLVLSALLLLALVGARSTPRVLREGGGYAAVGFGLPALGVVANVAWAAAMHLGTPLHPRTLVELAGGGPAQFVRLGREAVGVFGWQDTSMPKVAYVVWAALVVALLAGAFVLGGARHRLVVAGVLAVFVVVALAVTAFFEQNGFGVLGRYVLPGAAIVPLLAGEVVSRGRRLRLGPALVVTMVTLAAAIQVLAWLVNARRYAVGAAGPVLFLSRAEWSPPGGWVPWLVVILAAGLGQVSAAVLGSSWPWRSGRPRRVHPPHPREAAVKPL